MSELHVPDRVLFSPDIYRIIPGTPSGGTWGHAGTSVGFRKEKDILAIEVQAEKTSVAWVVLRWDTPLPADAQFLGDHWERAYGDLAWRGFVPERIMPWYFLCHSRHGTTGWGVRTGAAAFCFWTADARGISLWLDLRSGTEGVRLDGRTLRAAEIVTETWSERPFIAARELCRKMCPAPRLFPEPVYGANDFYYAYCKSTHETILRDSATLSELAGSAKNRPWSVIDDQWQYRLCCNDAPWRQTHPDFPDMVRLAREIREVGARPGIWIRPLMTFEAFPETWKLPSRPGFPEGAVVLDPSVPEVLEKIEADLRALVGWGYDLVKHDFTTFDLFTKWGYEMGAALTTGSWKFQDDSRTTAEIITGLYRAIRSGCGDAVVLGCNAVGHLGAGLFELQRTGNDTSGRNWEKTRRNGVNTLAYRMGQHQTFFAADADCVGLTRAIPWEMNRQWLSLLAESGTALFVSVAPDALGPEQKAALRDALAQAAVPREAAEPLDWLQDTCPQHWKMDGATRTFDWTGSGVTSPFNWA
jgi:alpha-galactosidase